ncbi:hypothetical protein ACKTEK_10165 [Tepidamorphus sp. 3E244]|uniref:hypothetical protein n=1 Tax=Tepidamorphus sp. 3E244 TaxID=3385498 RepID=UPI0038FC2C34
MTGVARVFFLSALIYGLAGMMLGISMAASHDHGQMPTHAHTMVIGWLSFAVFGLFYHHFPAAAGSTLARMHMWVAEVSLLVLIVGLFLLYGGNTALAPMLAIASIIYAASFAMFAWVAYRAIGKAA